MSLHSVTIGFPGIPNATYPRRPLSAGEENRVLITPFHLERAMDLLRLTTVVTIDSASFFSMGAAIYRAQNPLSTATPSMVLGAPDAQIGLADLWGEPMRWSLVDTFKVSANASLGGAINYVSDLKPDRRLLPGVYGVALQLDHINASFNYSCLQAAGHVTALLAEHRTVSGPGDFPERVTTSKSTISGRQAPFVLLRAREGLRSTPTLVETLL